MLHCADFHLSCGRQTGRNSDIKQVLKGTVAFKHLHRIALLLIELGRIFVIETSHAEVITTAGCEHAFM